MNQFGKFLRISSWVDPENLLMNVVDDFEMATLLIRQTETRQANRNTSGEWKHVRNSLGKQKHVR